MGRPYVGRFAPSPTGDLHQGSLYAAAASYLDARAHGGRWLLRMEDLDRPRQVPGSADRILATLEAFGFEWDGACLSQSARLDAYDAALADLYAKGLTFPCRCSRSQLMDEVRYPGTCRDNGGPPPREFAIRVRTDDAVGAAPIRFSDRIQGMFRQDVCKAVGDVVVRRRDGIVAYVLAVVVDDGAQAVSHVVRGADLLDNTPRQIYLQRLLGLPEPVYAHVPVLCEPGGAKLAKSRRSIAYTVGDRGSGTLHRQLFGTLNLLGLDPPPELRQATLPEMWCWAAQAWRVERVPRRMALNLNA